MLRGIASVEKFDVIALTETWLNMSDKDFETEVHIQGYNLYHKDRVGRRGGGVALYVRDSLQSYSVSSIKVDNNQESLWVEIKEGNEKLLMGLVYRPPNLSREATLTLLDEIRRACTHRRVCVMGDFNFRSVDWELMVGSSEAEDFLTVIQDNFLKQVIEEPTRGNSILDLVLTNRDNMVREVEIGEHLGNSDHCEIRFKLSWEEKEQRVNLLRIPDFRKGNYQMMRELLGRRLMGSGQEMEDFQTGADREGGLSQDEASNIPHSGVINPQSGSGNPRSGSGNLWLGNGNDPDILYSKFVDSIIHCQKLSIPYKTFRCRKNDPKWMTDRLKHYIGLKRGVYKRWKEGDEQLSERYRQISREVRKMTRVAKKDYEIRIAKEAKTNPKGFFQVYRTKNKENVGPLNTSEGDVEETDEGMSRMLNEYFLSVFTKENFESVPQVTQVFKGREDEKLKDVIIAREDILKEIDKLKKTKSPGPDEIFPRVIKECKDVVTDSLVHVFRNSIDTGIVPTLWKEANVVPIFKKGNRALTSNYRPVSLTSVIGKLLESIMSNKIREHLDCHNLIKDSQHGFTKGKSCLTNLLSFYRNVYETADSNGIYDIIYLDFSKAFDKVPHQRLLQKVKAHGIEEKILNWIRAWLSGRQQRVVINGSKSDWGEVTSGVPQGSVLGPLLFLIYINDLDDGISSDISKFADDTKIGRTIKKGEDVIMLQEDLDTLFEWAEKWQMEFNIGKCSVLSVGRNNPSNRYSINGTALKSSDSERDLGVRVNANLRHRQQCTEARNRANRVLGFISRSVSNRSAEVILKLYLALVRPHLDYAVQFWSPYYRMEINSLESVQRRMTKMIHGLRNLPYSERLKSLNLHSLERRRTRGDLIEVFKWMKGFNKGDVNKILKVRELGRNRSHGFKLDKFRFRKEIGRWWFSNRVVNDWNSLSSHVVEANTIECFKRRLDCFMDRDDRWT